MQVLVEVKVWLLPAAILAPVSQVQTDEDVLMLALGKHRMVKHFSKHLNPLGQVLDLLKIAEWVSKEDTHLLANGAVLMPTTFGPLLGPWKRPVSCPWLLHLLLLLVL